VRERLTFNHGTAAVAWPQLAVTATEPEVRPPPPAKAPVRDLRPTLAYWGAWTFTALLFFRPQNSIPLLEPLHLPEMTAIVGLLALLSARISAGQPPVRLMPELVGVLGFAAVMLVTVPFSVWPGGALNAFVDVYLKVALIFVLLTHSVLSIEMLRRLNWLMVLAIGYVAIRGTFDYVRGVNIIEGRLWGASGGLIGNPNDLAMNMVTFLPFALVVAFGREPRVRRVIAAVAAITMLAVIVFTKSRAGVLGVAAMLAVLIIQAGRIRSGLMVALVLGSLIVVPAAPPSIWSRVASIVEPEEDETGSREARVELMKEGWKTFLDHPLTGVGVSQFKNYNPPERKEMWRETHNVLLQVLAELGIGGGICFLFLMWCTAVALVDTRRLLKRERWRMRRAGPEDPPPALSVRELDQLNMHVIAATAGFAGWFTCAQFASIGYYWTYYYLLALIVIAREVARTRVKAVQRAVVRSGGSA
jgi:O-antigen ligase